MKYKYTLTQFIEDYTETSSGYERVVAENKFEVPDILALERLIRYLVGYSSKAVTIKIEKSEVEEVGLNG